MDRDTHEDGRRRSPLIGCDSMNEEKTTGVPSSKTPRDMSWVRMCRVFPFPHVPFTPITYLRRESPVRTPRQRYESSSTTELYPVYKREP